MLTIFTQANGFTRLKKGFRDGATNIGLLCGRHSRLAVKQNVDSDSHGSIVHTHYVPDAGRGIKGPSTSSTARNYLTLQVSLIPK